jgi:hypothetical protein
MATPSTQAGVVHTGNPDGGNVPQGGEGPAPFLSSVNDRSSRLAYLQSQGLSVDDIALAESVAQQRVALVTAYGEPIADEMMKAKARREAAARHTERDKECTRLDLGESDQVPYAAQDTKSL